MVAAKVLLLSLLTTAWSATLELENTTEGLGVNVAPQRPGWADHYDDILHQDEQHIHKVRETIFVARPRSTNTAPCALPPAPTGTALPPAPHILNTLRPLFDYGIHHPLRAMLYVGPWVGRQMWSAAQFITFSSYSATRYIFSSFVPFFSIPLSILLRPVYFSIGILNSLRAVWLAILASIVCGCGLGSIAGLLTAKEARALYDRRLGSSNTASRISSPLLGRQLQPSVPAGAKLERIDPKGKMRAMDGGGFDWRDEKRYAPLDSAGNPERPWYEDSDETLRPDSRGKRQSPRHGFSETSSGSGFEDVSEDGEETERETSSARKTVGTGLVRRNVPGRGVRP
ncbi:hypothetical protein P7C70_g70, partial [Phenoliferia sp. Uapishka_3]